MHSFSLTVWVPDPQRKRGSGKLRMVDSFCTVSKCGVTKRVRTTCEREIDRCWWAWVGTGSVQVVNWNNAHLLVLVWSWTHTICLRNRAFTCGLTPTYSPTGTVGREERVYYAKFTRPSLPLRVWYPTAYIARTPYSEAYNSRTKKADHLWTVDKFWSPGCSSYREEIVYKVLEPSENQTPLNSRSRQWIQFDSP